MDKELQERLYEQIKIKQANGMPADWEQECLDALEAAEERIAELEKITNNFVNLMTPDCEKHTGENTPPIDVFIRDYCGCAVCRVEENKRLDAALAECEDLILRNCPEAMPGYAMIIGKARPWK